MNNPYETASSTVFNLQGRAALVTGSAKGIGAGIATLLAQAGASVIVADVDMAAAEKTAGELTQAGHRAHAVGIDLRDEASIVRGSGEAVAHFGTPWVLVNNAGLQDRQLLLEGTASEWDRMHTVNARAPFLMTREIARAMVAGGQGGRIVNIASAVLIGSIIKGLVPYASSKGALLAMSAASAFELAEHAITVNTVLPGGVATPGAIAAKGPPAEGPARRKLPLGDICEPSDIAAAVLFFATPAARYITNQVIAVDGGFSVT
ncbi:MAG TPA: SDR family NAD(P)-dependent oxidoreductase [Steroidobacteraceae bacterium]|nr:SDR family NAD(P)-dependent oxidoreductase [Steroidobacteraceae bacterium]